MPGKLDLDRNTDYGFYPRLAKAAAEQQQAQAAYENGAFALFESGPHTSTNGPTYSVAENGLGAYVVIGSDAWFLSTFMGLPDYSSAYKDEVYAKAVLQLQSVK